ncbi:sensor histidine kinase [Variibacter gotjawalensis]|uniref:sensor histidine kinase n=1 Tax=Variibacter gotjawalensis TaxID=1333996 RepID=UPI000BBA8235|nr:HAMP domain-containing sensor histidine kinase [Variibacter gotjawalensis]NIK48128.1 signal transduction histidine kinase [Variibacter gotjawalensis]
MTDSATTTPAPGTEAQYPWSARLEQRIRAIPIRWRIFAIAALNTTVVLLLGALIWDGARVLTGAWNELRAARQADRLLVSIDSESVRLQSLIHRYFNQPQPHLITEIEARRQKLLDLLRTRAALEPTFAGSVSGLTNVTERFLAGFEELRKVRDEISRTYEREVLSPARDMAGLYAIIEGATKERDALIWPALSKSRESYSAALVAANGYYLSLASQSSDDAHRHIATIERTVPVMLDLADNDLQRGALRALGQRSVEMATGLNNLAGSFATQTRLLRESVDGNQTGMTNALDRLSALVRSREERAQERFDTALADVYWQVALVALAFLGLIIAIGVAIASSIRRPLSELKVAMQAIVSGDYDRRVRGVKAPDEIGEMARAVEVFRGNAVARRRAEDDLRTSKERAESTLADLRDTQRSLIEAEKLAALGGLVAGVAHEVNNPVGISLTVASSLARRCDAFADELAGGQLRRSRLDDFISGNREAAKQLVHNLERAGELIQSFKQVAVDRSHEQRRQFDMREATDQIVASLRPALKRIDVDLMIRIPEGIAFDSYPGAYGQVLTNLMLNATKHGFADGRSGTIVIEARPVPVAGDRIELLFADDGAGMSDDTRRRAFDPFFTTRRNEGGTGLGLHIVYNIIRRRLGGSIDLISSPGAGTRFRIILPLSAPREEATAPSLTLTDTNG